MRTWERTWPLPPGPTASASSPCTRTAASHEPQGAPGADRHRRLGVRLVLGLTLLRVSHPGSLGDHIRDPLLAEPRAGAGLLAVLGLGLAAAGVQAGPAPIG